jgi:hypothetical protein
MKVCALAAGGVVLLLAAAVTLILVDKPLVKSFAQKYVSRKAGMALSVGRLDYSLFPLRIQALSVRASYATKIYSISIAANRVEARGDIKKLLRGERPAFDAVATDIAELRFDQRIVSPEPIDFQSLIADASNLLGYAKRLEVRCGRLLVLLPAQDLRLDGLGLAVSTDRPGGALNITLKCASVAGDMSHGRLAFGGGVEAGGTLSLGQTIGFDIELALANPHVALADKAASVAGLTVRGAGGWRPAGGSFSLDKLAVEVPGLLSLTAGLDADARAIPRLKAEARAKLESLESLAAFAGPFLPSRLRDVRVRGQAGLELNYSLPQGRDATAGTFAASLTVDRLSWKDNGAGSPLQGELSGTLRARGLGSDPQGSGDISLSLGPLSASGARIRESRARLKFKGSKASAEISILEGKLKGVSVPVSGQKSLGFEEIELGGDVGLRFGRDPSVRAKIEARLPRLAPLWFSGTLGLSPISLRQAAVEGRGQPVPALRAILAPHLPAQLGSWTFDGTVDLSLRVESAAAGKGRLAFSGEISLSRGKFNDPGFVVAGDNLRSGLNVRGSYDPTTQDLTGAGMLAIPEGEFLWKRFYVSWNKFPLKAEIAGRYDRAAGGLEDLAVELSLASLGEARGTGRLRLASPLALELRTAGRLDLGQAFSLLSGSSHSPQGEIKLAGNATGDLDLKKSAGDLSLSGRVSLEDVSVDNSISGVSVQGLKAEIPIDLRLAGAPGAESAGAGLKGGSILVGTIKTAGLTLQPPPLSIASRPNGWEIAPLTLDLFGSRLEFGRIALSVRTSPLSFAGSASLRLADLDLSRLPFVSARFPLTGKARADFPTIEIAPTKIQSSGQAEFELFGGRVIARNVSIVDPFAPDREVGCDISILDLDLKKITDLVPFGEVTGIIRGEVRDLVIAYGQPERFALSLESVKRKGVPQTFSLKAVNSLTVITAGQQATQGPGPFWLRFIRGFRYDKIGIASTLKNDTFTIDGTIRENGAEYLVKRPRLFGISVINRMPGKSIGFKDMMSRLQRIGQSSPPVIK